jgi:hypothetical protein
MDLGRFVRMRFAYLALIEIDVANAFLVHTREIAEGLAWLGHEVTPPCLDDRRPQLSWGLAPGRSQDTDRAVAN